MTSVDTTSRHEPPRDPGETKETDATTPQALHALRLRFTGWHLWYGRATGRYWALSPTWCREHIGLIEADTPAELAARMQNIENYRPLPVADVADAPAPSSESKGGDRDGDAPAVRPRRRTR